MDIVSSVRDVGNYINNYKHDYRKKLKIFYNTQVIVSYVFIYGYIPLLKCISTTGHSIRFDWRYDELLVSE